MFSDLIVGWRCVRTVQLEATEVTLLFDREHVRQLNYNKGLHASCFAYVHWLISSYPAVRCHEVRTRSF